MAGADLSRGVEERRGEEISGNDSFLNGLYRLGRRQERVDLLNTTAVGQKMFLKVLERVEMDDDGNSEN